MRVALSARVELRWLTVTRLTLGVAALLLAFDTRDVMVDVARTDRIRIPVLEMLPTPTRTLANVVLVVWVLAGLLVLIGRLAGPVLIAALGVFVQLIDEQLYSNHLTLVILLMVFLACAIAESDATRTRYWPLFLMKTQLATLYLWTGVAKMNSSYLEGETIESGTVSWLRERASDRFFVVVAVAILVTELFLAVALWSRPLRPVAYVVGVGMHVGIMAIGSLPVELIPFGLATLAVYPLFLLDPVFGQGGWPTWLRSRGPALIGQ